MLTTKITASSIYTATVYSVHSAVLCTQRFFYNMEGPQLNFCTKHISNPLHTDKTNQTDQNFPLIQTHVDFGKIIKKKKRKKSNMTLSDGWWKGLKSGTILKHKNIVVLQRK